MLKKFTSSGATTALGRAFSELGAPWFQAVEKSIEKNAVWITSHLSTARCAWIWWIASCSAKLGQWLKTEKCCEQCPCGGGFWSFSAWFQATWSLNNILVPCSWTPRYVSWSPQLCCKTPQVIDRVSYTFAIWKVRRGNARWWWPTWVRPFLVHFQTICPGVFSSRYIHSAVDLKCQSANPVNGRCLAFPFQFIFEPSSLNILPKASKACLSPACCFVQYLVPQVEIEATLLFEGQANQKTITAEY